MLINKSLVTFRDLEIFSTKHNALLLVHNLILIFANLRKARKKYPGVRTMSFDLVISMMTCINFGEGLRM